MGISRTVQSPTSLHRTVSINRLRRHDINQVRCLWWWGKQTGGWLTSQQDDVEERFRRHQALMMHRYTKAMRRRSLWDRENSPAVRWSRCGFAKMDRDMSSTDPMRAKVENREPEKKPERQTWDELFKDFDTYKKAIDRAIERDPYGTLFGRRLQSPDTANNSSWTSWSWIFDPKAIKQHPTPDPPNQQEQQKSPADKQSSVSQTQTARTTPNENTAEASVSHSSSSSKTSSTIKSSQSIIFQDRNSATTEYIYDPISGRKIVQTLKPLGTALSPLFKESKALEPQKDAPTKGLVKSLFAEHGTPIAVKLYKPPKVSGYTGEAKPKPNTSSISPIPKESSKKREFNDLRWRTMGNNIDSTNFNCEPWNKDPEVSSPFVEQLAEEQIGTSPAPSEDNPLFSGTTYESRSSQLMASQITPQKDDFRAKQGMTIPSLKFGQQPSSRSFEPALKIEPTIDRANTPGLDIPVKKFVSKLPTSIDRVVGSSKLEPATDRIVRPASKTDSPRSVLNATTKPRVQGDEHQDKREDIDLLRASDVRANTKSIRVTKQATEEKKQQERTTLEQLFDQNAVSDKQNLEVVWKHVKQYPSGVVAKTMQRLGVHTPHEAAVATSTTAPKFSEPTTRPGVVRDRAMEAHTQRFEPRIANIVDQARSIKRNLHDVTLTIGGVINERAITAMANRDIFVEKTESEPVVVKESELSSTTPIQNTVRAQVLEKITTEKESSDVFSSKPPFIVLYSFPITGQVRSLPMHKLLPQFRSSQPEFSPMAALGLLSNPGGFVKHFTKLDQMGYNLINGSKDFLVFHKKETIPLEQRVPFVATSSSTSLRASIAAEEASSQPKTQDTRKPNAEPLKAAEVLDQLPTTIPTPGPAAPTAPISPIGRPFTEPAQKPTKSPGTPQVQSTKYIPIEYPSIPLSRPEQDPQPTSTQPQDPSPKPRRGKSRIVRQEEVFSGTRRLKPQTTGLPDPEHFQKQTPFSSQQSQQQEYDSAPRLGFFARVRRAIRRTVLTAFAFGAGAYGLGVVAEGLQARAQIAHGEEGGPMKRVVFEGDAKRVGDRQRAGIFSTESSR